MFVYPFASICLLIVLSICLRLLSTCLSVCVCLSHQSICVCLTLPLCLPGRVCLSVGLPVYRSVGNHSVCLSVACLSVCGQFVCVCYYAAKSFCADSYFLGAAPSKSHVKQHSDTNHSANVGHMSVRVRRYLSIVCRGPTFRDRFGSLLAQWNRDSDHNS